MKSIHNPQVGDIVIVSHFTESVLGLIMEKNFVPGKQLLSSPTQTAPTQIVYQVYIPGKSSSAYWKWSLNVWTVYKESIKDIL